MLSRLSHLSAGVAACAKRAEGAALPAALRCLSSLAAPHILPVTGLFGIPRLTTPQSWRRLADEAIERCEELVQKVQLSQQPLDVVQYLDDISDAVCQVYDAAEFCRNVHADPVWRDAAQDACMYLADYIGHLNTHAGLYSALVRAIDRGSVPSSTANGGDGDGSSRVAEGGAGTAACSGRGGSGGASASRQGELHGEALLVATMLRRDFEKSGIHLPAAGMQRLRDLTLQSQATGMQIGSNLVCPDALGRVSLQPRELGALAGLPLPRSGLARGAGGSASFVADTASCTGLLRYAADEGLRRKVFAAMSSSPAANLSLVEALVAQRAEMAALLGAPSYAAYQASAASLADSPTAVDEFLARLANAIRPQAVRELHALREHKYALAGSRDAVVQPWDRYLLLGSIKARQCDGASAAVAEYFPLPAALEGLGQLLARLMGVALADVSFEAGEAWADGLSKLAVTHEQEGLLGHVYLDLHPRPGKFPHAAHFTLRCGRALHPNQAAAGNGDEYQRPLVALVTNFPGGRGSLLSYSELQTLYHEFGHVLHSLLSRTRFQHLAGTRGALDIVEVPSHLMEHFATDARCLRLWARHVGSGDPIPQRLVAALRSADRAAAALDLEQQVLLSMVDQRLHSVAAVPPGGAAAAVAEVLSTHSTFPHDAAALPQLRFGHLVGYGGCYYSYLYAGALAAGVWDKLFEADPLSRTSGEMVRRLLLQPGGAEVPHVMVSQLLGPDALQQLRGGWAPDAQPLLASLGLDTT